MAIVVLDVWDAQLPAVLVVEADVQILVIKLAVRDAEELVVQDVDRIVKVIVIQFVKVTAMEIVQALVKLIAQVVAELLVKVAAEKNALEDVQLVHLLVDKDVRPLVEDVLILVQVIVVQ